MMLRNYQVVRHKQRLDSIFQKVSTIDDAEMQSHWARYLCVLASGFLEQSIRVLLSDMAGHRGDAKVAGFVRKSIGDFQNAKMGKVLSLLERFDDKWAKDLERKTEGKLKAAVDSIVTNRHQIAHGETVGISYVVVRDYYKSIVRVVELVEEIISS